MSLCSFQHCSIIHTSIWTFFPNLQQNGIKTVSRPASEPPSPSISRTSTPAPSEDEDEGDIDEPDSEEEREELSRRETPTRDSTPSN